MDSMLFVNVLVIVLFGKLYIKPHYVRKPSMFKLVALLNTDNDSEMQELVYFALCSH